MKKNMKTRGVTLIELLIVVIILAALAMIAIPRISQSADNAKGNACATNVDLINSAIEMYYVDHDGAWPGTLAGVTGSTTYFPDGAPACPLSGTYSMDGTTHRVTCNH
jgi:prepilin-type N-terminal cleavage/methylation domain-containing protein